MAVAREDVPVRRRKPVEESELRRLIVEEIVGHAGDEEKLAGSSSRDEDVGAQCPWLFQLRKSSMRFLTLAQQDVGARVFDRSMRRESTELRQRVVLRAAGIVGGEDVARAHVPVNQGLVVEGGQTIQQRSRKGQVIGAGPGVDQAMACTVKKGCFGPRKDERRIQSTPRCLTLHLHARPARGPSFRVSSNRIASVNRSLSSAMDGTSSIPVDA